MTGECARPVSGSLYGFPREFPGVGAHLGEEARQRIFPKV